MTDLAKGKSDSLPPTSYSLLPTSYSLPPAPRSLKADRYHAWAWMIWTAAALVALSATRNPLYLALTLMCIGVVSATVTTQSSSGPIPLSPIRFGMVVVPLSALFNAATAHIGRHVLFRLPHQIPLLGGPITLEALVFGALNGLVLTGIFAAFTVLNKALPVRSLTKFIPRAFYPVAVVVSIALTFVPTTLRQFQQIREAQAIRGHRIRGLRDWLPLFLPLLVGGLERALQLAEAMVARGLASTQEQAHDWGTRLAIAQGLAAIAIGWLLRVVWRQDLLGLALMLAGLGLVLAALWLIGRRVPRTTYRKEPWTARDSAMALSAVVVMAAYLMPVPGLNREIIFYNPYPALTAPRFDPFIGAATLALLGPALLALRPQSSAISARSGAGTAKLKADR